MADGYWKGGVNPGLAPFSGYAHGMVAATPASQSAPRPGEPPPRSGVHVVDPPLPGQHAPNVPPPRAPFYSFRAIFVPTVPSTPPAAGRTFGQRLRSAFLVIALPALAALATYAALTHRPAAASYVFVVNSTAQPVDLVVDGARHGAVGARSSTRLALGVGPHVITALGGPQSALVDEATVQVTSAGARSLFNIGGGASLAVVTRGYGASHVDRVQPVPPGRVVPLPPEVGGDRVDQPFPTTVTASEGQVGASLAQLCSYDAARRRVGCADR